jgi:hypothetical protein
MRYFRPSAVLFRLLVESGIVSETQLAGLRQEADELLRMTMAAIKKAKSNS